MMQFESDIYIWSFALILIMLLLFRSAFKKYLRLLNQCFQALREQSRVKYWPHLKLIQFVLILLALTSAILALMKPYSGYELKEVEKKGIDLYFLVDLSPSMLAEDVKPNRLQRVKYEIQDFLNVMTGDRVGLIGFSGEAYVFVPLTTDYRALKLFLNELDTNLIPSEGTNIKAAIEKGVDSLKKQSQASEKAMILLTDGEDSLGIDQSVLKDIQSHQIKTYVMGIGTSEGAPIPNDYGGFRKDKSGKTVLTQLNEQALQGIAKQTYGNYVRSITGDSDRNFIYQQGIKKDLSESISQAETRKLPHYIFHYFAFLALGLLFLEYFVFKTDALMKRVFT